MAVYQQFIFCNVFVNAGMKIHTMLWILEKKIWIILYK